MFELAVTITCMYLKSLCGYVGCLGISDESEISFGYVYFCCTLQHSEISLAMGFYSLSLSSDLLNLSNSVANTSQELTCVGREA